jgi:hypothetical protein
MCGVSIIASAMTGSSQLQLERLQATAAYAIKRKSPMYVSHTQDSIPLSLLRLRPRIFIAVFVHP